MRNPTSFPTPAAGAWLLALCLLLLPAAGAAGQVVVASATSAVDNLVRTESTVQVGPGPLDRFQVVRLAKENAAPVKGALLLLPPLGSTFATYEQKDASGGAGTSLAGWFAQRGYVVYGYVPRYAGIPGGTCEAGLFGCSVMAGWNLQSQLDDLAFIRQGIEADHPGVPVVAGGLSLGGILAVAVANGAPADYAGVIVWEGMLASDDPGVLALNDAYCDALEAQLAAGIVYDGVGNQVLKQIAGAAELEPGGVTIIPLFPPFLTNQQVLVLALTTPNPGPFTMPTPGFIQANGSLAEERLFFASEERLFANVDTFNDYVPLAVARDISCSLAGQETAYVSNLGSFTGPVLAIGGGRAFGPYMPYQLSLFGSDDVTFLLEPDFGHIDHFMTDDHREYLEQPITQWLQGVVGQ